MSILESNNKHIRKRTTIVRELIKILAEGTDKNGYQFILGGVDINIDKDKKEISIKGFRKGILKRFRKRLIDLIK